MFHSRQLVGNICALFVLLVVGSIGATRADTRTLIADRSSAPRVVNPVFRPILSQLRGLLVPVLLPTYIPSQSMGSGQLSATVDDVGHYSYIINLGFTPDCHGATACRFGEVGGGPEIDSPTIFDYPRGRHVRLHNGTMALFFPSHCGASCGDSVLVFQKGGVVYTVGIKSGSLTEVLSMADSFALAISP